MAKKQTKSAPVQKNTDDMRKEIHQLVDDVLERVLKKNRVQPDGHYPDFTERESLMALLGREVMETFMEAGLISDPRYQEILKAESLPCPDCSTSSTRAKDAQGQNLMDEIIIESKVGNISLPAPLFRCDKCRRNFSPLKTFIGSPQSVLQPKHYPKGELGWW